MVSNVAVIMGVINIVFLLTFVTLKVWRDHCIIGIDRRECTFSQSIPTE